MKYPTYYACMYFLFLYFLLLILRNPCILMTYDKMARRLTHRAFCENVYVDSAVQCSLVESARKSKMT